MAPIHICSYNLLVLRYNSVDTKPMWLIHSNIAPERVDHLLGTIQIHSAERTYRILWWRARRTVEYIAFFPASQVKAGSSEDRLRAMQCAVGVGMSRETALLALVTSYWARIQLCDREPESKLDADQMCASFPSVKHRVLTIPRLQQTEMV